MSQVTTASSNDITSLNVPVPPFYTSRGNETVPKIDKTCEGTFIVNPAKMKTDTLNDKKRLLSESSANKYTSNHVTFLRTYKVIYLGYAVLDRRYTLPMLPWVIAEIKRHGSHNMEEIFIEVTDQALKAVICKNRELVFEHKLQTISKFAQSSHDSSCFTYMTREVVNGPCAYHVFQANDENTVLELFTTIREATKEISCNQVQAPNVLLSSALKAVMNNCQQYEVLYLGRIKVSGKRAPPTFIDDAVEKFRLYEAEKVRNSQNGHSRKRHGSGASVSSLPYNLNLIKNGNENGLDKHVNCDNSCVISSDSKNLDVFNYICCDNSTENFVQSPLSSMCHPDELHKFYSFNQSTVFHSDDPVHGLSHTQKESKNVYSRNNLMPPSSLITHTQSLDAPGCADIVRDLQDFDTSITVRDRVRSCSGDIRRTKQTSLPNFRQRLGSGGANELVRPRAYTSPNPSNNHQQNRTMLFIIGRLEICLIGMDKKQMLLSKTFSDIAHCSQGIRYLDHFGFISREISETGCDFYAGYIFRCQTERVVDEIMSSLKQAFKHVHQTVQNFVPKNQVPKMTSCETCPMNWLHVLCSDVEGLKAEEAHLIILQRLGTLPDRDKEEIMVKFQKSDFSNVQEQNEVLMIIFREFCEQKQRVHTHISGNQQVKNEVFSTKHSEKHSKLDTFREKARKSLSSSFETFLKLKNRDESKDFGSVSESRSDITVSEDEDLDTRSVREGSYSEELSASDRLSPLLSRPRSSTFSSPGEKVTVHKKKQQLETPKKRPIMNMFIKSGYQNKTPQPSVENSPKGSWRQAIFHKVQTPVNKKQVSIRLDSSSPDEESNSKVKKSKDELKALWKKAIIEQILLIRMEKENKKLQVNQDAASYKRMKLSYREITPCLKYSAQKWEEMLQKKNEILVDRTVLTDMVKSGIPRNKRGDIWELLADYNMKTSGSTASADIDLSVTYEDLLKQLTSHQHSILIDIGRTFPNHPYYSQQLGSGQLSLFNLLKAYSLMDKEVGYCQGLSFVAGILLLHLPEERAFSLMKYLMFNLGLRRQYKTDMVAFQIQMYQLTRLIHDTYPDLYDHLEKFDIAPTLYAAPWFLTLFASQYPIGFVARFFDLIFLSGIEVVFKVSLILLGNNKSEILSLDSFESITEFLKSTLPSMEILQMEILFNQVFNLDISRQLHAYEVEYHVLLEEMIHSPSKSNAEVENLQTANKNLKAQNMELMEQLQVAYSRIHTLEASESSLKSSVRRLEGRVATLEDEKEALQYSLRMMKKRCGKMEVAIIEAEGREETEEHPPSFGTVYALAGSEKEEDQRFKQLMKKISLSKEPGTGQLPEEEDTSKDIESDSSHDSELIVD